MKTLQRGSRKLYKQDIRQLRQELSWLWKRILRHRGMILWISFLSLTGAGMGLASSVASKYLIDAVTLKNTTLLYNACIAMVLLVLGSVALRATSSRFGTRTRIYVRNLNQKEVYDRILRSSWQALEPYRSGDLLQRLNNDVGIVSDGVISFIPNVLSAGIQMMGALCIMLYFDPAMALFALLGLSAALLFSRAMMRRTRRHDQKIKALGSELMAFQEDTFRNLTSIKAFFVTERFSGQMDKLQNDYAEANMDMNATQIRISSLTTLCSSLLVGTCFCWSVYRLWIGQMSVGSLMLFMQLIGVLRSALSTGLSLAQQTVSLTTSASRIMAVEALPEENTRIPEGFSEQSTLSVAMESVSFHYSDGIEVLQPFGFYANAGDTVAVIGPSGEGKTTLLRLLLGLIDPCSGSAALVDTDGNRFAICAGTRRAFAYVPQGNSVFGGNIAHNLRMVKPDATDEELEQVLHIACAEEFVKELPGGLEYTLGAGGRGISEGQAQRIAIARALLQNAPILLLDEATSAMDIEMENRLLQNLRNSGRIRTCILVTHRPGSAQFCNRAYEVREGTVTEVDYGA